MRNIKFRVWDTLAKRYIYPDSRGQGHYSMSLNGVFYNLQNGSGGDEYIVEQYTGLKDKNGKDICEGDILSDDKVHVLCEDYSMKSLYVVDYADGSYKNPLTYQSLNGSKFFKTEWLDRAKNRDYAEMTIVGNIMENPELLQ